MSDSREAIRKELDSLLQEIDSFVSQSDENEERLKVSELGYQAWYTKALVVVRQLMPERLDEFKQLYKLEKRKKIDFLTYTISDYLLGVIITRGPFKEEVVNADRAFSSKFNQQVDILASAHTRLDSILSDIVGVLKADLFDNEIDAARSLLKSKHLRAAGTVAGMVLENHLRSMCENHKITIRKKTPAIGDYNDALKKSEVLDVATWRWVQRLADIRNLCCHAKDRDPTLEEVDELIKSVEKAVKTLF